VRIETRGRRTTTHQQYPSRRATGGVLRALTQVGGELLITVGAILLLFVVYEVYVTDQISAGRQQDATEALEDRWTQARMGPEQPQELEPLQGEGILRLYAPALGPDFTRTVLEGTSQDILATGPGHYTGTALPGQPGNLAIAGHRVGHGAPFNRIDLLQSCDALIVETLTGWFVYRVLPMPDELAEWAQGKGTQPRCRGVAPLSAPYPVVPGQETVLPSNGTVIAAVPGQPRHAVPAPEARAQLITLTTCTPKFSAQQRLIVHGVLVAQYPSGGGPPAELVGG
jgi:sortase A